MKDISKSISMHCPICGNDLFGTLDDNCTNLKEAPDETKIQCSDCKRICTKAELIKENQKAIDANLEDLKKEALVELKKDLGKIFKIK